jgi:hypothetical protein
LKSRPALTLFLGALLLYNLNGRPIPSGDTETAALLPLELVLHGRFNLDDCQALLQQYYGSPVYFLQERDGHYYSKFPYPVAEALLLTPLYTPLALVPGARTWPAATEVLVARLIEKVMASLIAAASVALLFLLMRRITSERRALLLAAVNAFATNTWSTSSQALWEHGASELTTVASLLCLVMFLQSGNRWPAVAAGLFAALSVAMRPTDLLFLAVSLAVVSWRAPRPSLLASYAGFAALIGGSLAGYNLWLFGSLRGGYMQPFDRPFWTGVAGLAVSPSHGLFIFSPVLLFAFAGAYSCLRDGTAPGRVLWPIALLFIVSQVMLVARWPHWFGGNCYGPRMLTDVLPCFVLLIVGALDWMARHRPLQVAFAATLAFSVAAQFVGAFCFPLGFHSPEALWDWRHCPIVENARQGVTLRSWQVAAGWADDVLHGRKPDTAHSGQLIH